MKVFVYGTLKHGYGNSRLLAGCNLLSVAYLNNHKLLHAGFPVLVQEEGSRVRGEVYEIPEAIQEQVITRLDWLENEGSMYDRITITVNDGDVEGQEHEVQTYLGNPKFWDDFKDMKPEPIVDGAYQWNR